MTELWIVVVTVGSWEDTQHYPRWTFTSEATARLQATIFNNSPIRQEDERAHVEGPFPLREQTVPLVTKWFITVSWWSENGGWVIEEPDVVQLYADEGEDDSEPGSSWHVLYGDSAEEVKAKAQELIRREGPWSAPAAPK